MFIKTLAVLLSLAALALATASDRSPLSDRVRSDRSEPDPESRTMSSAGSFNVGFVVTPLFLEGMVSSPESSAALGSGFSVGAAGLGKTLPSGSCEASGAAPVGGRRPWQGLRKVLRREVCCRCLPSEVHSLTEGGDPLPRLNHAAYHHRLHLLHLLHIQGLHLLEKVYLPCNDQGEQPTTRLRYLRQGAEFWIRQTCGERKRGSQR